MGYFFNDLCNLRYEVPVVYFDIAHAYDKVARELLMNQAFQGMPSDEIILEKNFVRASAIDYLGYEEVCLYEELVMSLIKGKITVDSLLNHKIKENSNTMKNSIISATMSQLPIQNKILM